MTDFNWDTFAVPTDTTVINNDGLEPDVDGVDIGPVDEPDPAFVKAPRRSRNAAAYEKKIAVALNAAMRATASRPGTVADAAAIIQYGPEIARAGGDLAAHDERVARAIDLIGSGTDNPYAACVFATLPLCLQMVRNHEPILEPTVRTIKIGKRVIPLKVKIGIRLGGLRNAVHDPDHLTREVFDNPAIAKELDKRGISVAWPKRPRRE
jgi:hypothetical protein